MPPRLVVEYAKSARAACKACGSTMAKGSVRLGSISKAEAGFDVTRWYHPNCFLKGHLHEDVLNVDEINGFQSLKVKDQMDLKKTAEDFEKVNVETSPKRLKTEDEARSSNKDSLENVLKNFSPSHLSNKYKDASLPAGWNSYLTVIVGKSDDLQAREKIAAFDFDGCLVKTSVYRTGADAWSLLYPGIPKKLQDYYDDGYKLHTSFDTLLEDLNSMFQALIETSKVVFTNESNIDRWKNSRQKAVDSKIGRLQGFMKLVKRPMQVFIACGKEGTGDAFRKPKVGMWTLMEDYFNSGVTVVKERSFYVGDAAGRSSDHSDADIGFAKAIGLEFFLPEDIFMEGTQTKS